MSFQTFLLDDANKVIAIGNPIHNPKVKELYLRILTGKTENGKKLPLTTVGVVNADIDFGSFSQSEKQKITLSNKGNCPLVIQDITASCGCIKVEYSHAPVKPNGILELTIIYKAEKPEHFNKTINIYCNIKDSPLHISIIGDAK